MLIRIAGIVPESFVDGAGIRYAIFMQGCLRNCEGCHNPNTHDLRGGQLVDTSTIIADFKRNHLLSGITLTGGEPLLQIDASNELASAAKNLGLNVWCYTGYTFETLPVDAAQLMKNVDVLIDGAFDITQRDLDLPFRGSRNQRLIDVDKTLACGQVVLDANTFCR